MDPDLCWDLDTDDVVMGVVRFCNPLITLEWMEDFIGFWRECSASIASRPSLSSLPHSSLIIHFI